MAERELTPEEKDNREKMRLAKPRVSEKMQKFDEKIRRGESIAIIQFQYNYVCNFRCQHCSIKPMQHDRGRRSFTIDDVKSLSRQADELGLARFVITGGEPLVFKDFDQLVAAIDPEKFFINCDTNGWFLDDERAKHLKGLGIDRIQLSVDSLDPEEHDSFRAAPGSHARAMRAVDAAQKAGLGIFIQTVVTKERLHSDEFIQFVEYFNKLGIGVFVSYAKPVGAWEGRFENLINRDDMAYMRTLEQRYRLFTHLTPAYGMDLGCIAVKGMISVTQYGDVQPCPYIHITLGNVFREPLKDIIDRGLKINFFGEHVDTCPIAEDRNFLENYIAKHVYGKPLPVAWDEVFTDKDSTKVPFHKSL